jgi:hypothetical protein
MSAWLCWLGYVIKTENCRFLMLTGRDYFHLHGVQASCDVILALQRVDIGLKTAGRNVTTALDRVQRL